MCKPQGYHRIILRTPHGVLAAPLLHPYDQRYICWAALKNTAVRAVAVRRESDGSREIPVRFSHIVRGSCGTRTDIVRYSYDDDLGNGMGAVRFEGPEIPSPNRTASVRMLRGPYWAPAVPVRCCRRVYGLTAITNFYDTSGTFNSALKAPDAPYGKERTPRRLQDSHGTLAAAVRFCKFSPKFGPVRAPYPESVDM